MVCKAPPEDAEYEVSCTSSSAALGFRDACIDGLVHSKVEFRSR